MEVSHYDPYKLSLVPRQYITERFNIKDNDYEVRIVSKPKENNKLSKNEASKFIALALTGAITLGASLATINIIFKGDTSIEYKKEYITYNVPAEITELNDVKIRVFQDGSAIIILDDGTKAEYYNGKNARKILDEASTKGMLYRNIDVSSGRIR